MTDLIPSFCLDLLCVGAALWVMFKRLRLIHPFTIYLYFHVYCFTQRAWHLVKGAVPMYGLSLNLLPISAAELSRALSWADIALVLLTLASFAADRIGSKNRTQEIQNPGIALSRRAVIYTITIFLPIGLAAFAIVRFVGRDVVADWSFGNYISVTALWPMTCLCLLIFRFGFKPIYLVPAFIFLAIVGIQGGDRFMLILPTIFLAALFVLRSGRRWPSTPLWATLIVLAVLFPALKELGTAVQTGETGKAAKLVSQSFGIDSDNAFLNDETYLDQFAGALSLSDAFAQRYYGRSYLALLTLPVPRAWWPDKPGLADSILSIATPDRPYNVEGRIVTYLGEAYINFGYVGLVLYPLVIGFFLTLYYQRALLYGPYSRELYRYLLIYSVAVQGYRDGLTSFILFGFIFNVPAVAAFFIQRTTTRTSSHWGLAAKQNMPLGGHFGRATEMFRKNSLIKR